jgi:hypothetical protein
VTSSPVRRQADRTQILLGIIAALLLHLLQLPIGLVVKPALAYIGLTQWLYMVPAILVARRAGQTALVTSLCLGGAVTFLLNAVAYGVAYYLFFVPR